MIFHSIIGAPISIPNPKNKPQVNHIDNNPFNNRVDNLEWVNNSENVRHSFNYGYRTKYGTTVLNTETGVFYNSIPEAARCHNLNKNSLRAQLIGRCINKTNLVLI